MANGSTSGDRLDSWKDIAAYLRRDVRTAIRWEKEKGLPVRRVPGGHRQAVFAYTEELDAWLTQEDSTAPPPELKPVNLEDTSGANETVPFPKPASPRSLFTLRARYFALAVIGGIGVLVFVVFGMRSHTSRMSSPVRVDFTVNAVQAYDDKGLLLWSHAFPGNLWPEILSVVEPLNRFSSIGDFRGKGDQEVLLIAPYRASSNRDDPGVTEVDLFSSGGERLWSYVPRGQFQFGKHELNGSWEVLDLFVSSHQDKKQIWASVSHGIWGNSFVVTLDPETGKETLRFVNTGVVRALSEIATPRGTFLLVGGFNNEADTGSLAVIDESKPFAASPQSEGTRHKCLSCPPGDPDYYFVFPRSELNELAQAHDDTVVQARVTGDQIEIRKEELTAGSDQETVYLLAAENVFRVVSLRFESTYDMLHRKLEREGKIGHSLEQCPERLHPRPIKMWTPSGGWTEIQLPPTRADE